MNNVEITDNQWLFLDMNSFFASVEQQERPELRGKPVVVAPMLSDATCVIAASYAAKPFGVKTGTNIKVARQMCPELIVVEARPSIYVDYHRKLIETVHEELPDPKTLSVDEIACKLWANEQRPSSAVKLALHLKDRLRVTLGDQMKSSVGIAPNVFLAKVAADLYKPNGLTFIHRNDLPDAFRDLSLRDLPGVGRNMHAKLHAFNIHTIAQLYQATEAELGQVWGGVVGRRWWYMLRGSNDADYGALADPAPRGVSNSHVLEPALRTIVGAESVLLRLLGKAAARMRTKGQLGSRLHLSLSFQGDGMRRHSWKCESGHVDAAADLLTWLPIFRALWSKRPRLEADFVPKKVCVAFSNLIPTEDISLYLFESDSRLSLLSNVVDSVNSQYKSKSGRHDTVDVASVFWLNHHAPERIAFRKITDDDRERKPDTA
jgi:DNA polymerase-4